MQAMLAKRFQISEWCRKDTTRDEGSDRGKEGIPDLAQNGLEELQKVLPMERLLSNIRALKKLMAPVAPP